MMSGRSRDAPAPACPARPSTASSRLWPLARRAVRLALDRLRADRSVGLEAGNVLARDPVPEERLDLAEESLLVDTHQRDRVAGRAGPARPADPVDVV